MILFQIYGLVFLITLYYEKLLSRLMVKSADGEIHVTSYFIT
jgi:hypothetical protein